MAPFKLNFRMGTSSRSTSQESSSEATATATATAPLATTTTTTTTTDYSHHQLQQQQLRAKFFAVNSEVVPESRTDIPSMEFEDEERARNDRSALLQHGTFYNVSSHPQEQNAYDNPTIQSHEQDENPNEAASAASGNLPISPPPSYEHVLNENRLYAPVAAACPHHSSLRLSGDEAALESVAMQGSESDSESQCNIESCCCQLIEAPMDQPQCNTNLLGPADSEAITLEASDTYPEEMFAAWQNRAAQNGGEIEISNKCSKKLYKMASEQYAICKMSSECRCDDCQSHYFDCDFDNNEHQKTDGGLGAGTPMFINEVMHGAACNIL